MCKGLWNQALFLLEGKTPLGSHYASCGWEYHRSFFWPKIWVSIMALAKWFLPDIPPNDVQCGHRSHFCLLQEIRNELLNGE